MKFNSFFTCILAFAALFTMNLSALDYSAPERPDNSYSVPMRADTDFSPGRMLAVDLEGYAAQAADEEGLVVLGRLRQSSDSTGYANGEVKAVYDHGVFAWDNSTAYPVTMAQFGRPVFVEDDITVTSEPGTHSIFAGICRGFEPSGKVWVDSKLAAVLQASV